ncbi:uncharacterized protein LOC120116385 isoform X1 [Hibiscus syriacus]|uniref:uncharacterized protein LOC120116385 isoform X1 n=1 Tax=Hibiscus syriacus TaxID=106335 RepID=UPI0019239669|nr:uncharacterized protein LOC120116385 isoform X1 [Hibiscus syriacus]XP_038992832.1 uncharacterized protein LOC120116385 isoform X1 [Hibiscus syriacus]
MSHVDDYWKDRAFLSRGDLQGQQPENVALEVQSDTFMMSHADDCSEGIDFSDLHKYLNSVPHGDQDQQPENAPFEAQSGMNEPQISPGDNQENSSGRKRDRGVTLNFSDAKEKRPRRQSWRRGTDFTSESSTPGEPEKTEELTYAEQITPLTVGKSAKLLIDRINHRLKSARELLHNSGGIRDTIEGFRSRAAEIQGMMKDGGAMKAEFQKVMKVEIQKSMKDMDDTEAKIQEFRKDMHATEAEIQRIKKVITKIPKDGKLTVAAAKQRLINMENEYFKKFLQDLQNARKMYKQILQETNKIDEKML